MKKNSFLPWMPAILGIVCCAVLFAFAARPGAHNVQVYLDDQLLLDQYIHTNAAAPKLTVDATDNHRNLIVKYNECGRTVTGRKISIKDSDNKVLKEWTFDGSATGFEQPMACPIKEVMALKQKKGAALKLYYSSNDFPAGQQIAYLLVGDNRSTASN